MELANAPTQFLSTIQIGITLIAILTGAFGGAIIGRALAVRLRHISWLAPYSESVALILVVIAITYFIAHPPTPCPTVVCHICHKVIATLILLMSGSVVE